MNQRGKKLTAVLAGGVVLASGAYGIGTQAGDGSATAARSQQDSAARGDRDHPFGLSGLADRLGVSEDKLQDALGDLRGELKPGAKRRSAFEADLAKELGVETSQVRAAFRKLRAKERKEHTARRAEFVKKLADKLGISEEKVKDAFPAPSARMRFRGPGPGGPGGPGFHPGGPGGPPGGPGF